MAHQTFNRVALGIWVALAAWSAIFLFWSWQIVLAMGFMVTFGVRWRERVAVRGLSRIERRIHIFSALGFPVILTGWKTLQLHLGLTDGGGIPNRVQHASWAFSMIGLFLPVFRRWWKDLDVLDAAIIAIGFVVALGVGVELLEAVGKVDVPAAVQASAFRDTMKDFVANAVGASVGFLMVWIFPSHESAQRR